MTAQSTEAFSRVNWTAVEHYNFLGGKYKQRTVNGCELETKRPLMQQLWLKSTDNPQYWLQTSKQNNDNTVTFLHQ